MTAQLENVTSKELDRWATDMNGPVALHLKQKLVPVEVDGSIIFPPTYADIGYNIDTLSDGTCVATIDSVGSQANRIEPLFKVAGGTKREEWLVPQIQIVLRAEDCGECNSCKAASEENPPNGKKTRGQCTNPHKVRRSILDLAHRGADALVQSCPKLSPLIEEAFQKLRRSGDAALLCEIVPTSLVFGVWDSRGGSGEKRPRLVRSIIRAWDVEPLHAAAQFNSVWKLLDEEQRQELDKEAKAKKVELSAKGFNDAPATFRKVGANAARNLQEFRDGSPNPERRVLGGVIVRGSIEREVTINLVALRGLCGKNKNGKDETEDIRKYLLGLTLVAATKEIDLFLREGCHLRYGSEQDQWHKIPRRGEPTKITLQDLVREYATGAAGHFRNKWGERWSSDQDLEYEFVLNEAKRLLVKKTDDEAPSAST
jgi:CRISPR-associated protein Csb1